MKVGILRHTQLVASEPFILDQARAVDLPFVLLARDYPAKTLRPDGAEEVVAFAGSSLGRARYTLLRDTSMLERAVRDFDVGVIHAHFGVEGLYASGATRRLDRPLVTTLHGYDVTRSAMSLAQSGSPAMVHYSVGRRAFLRESRALIAVSSFAADAAVRHGARSDAIEVVSTGVDTKLYSYVEPSGAPTVVHIGRLVPVKGTAHLLDAFRRVLLDVPEARLRIIGDGPLRSSLVARASSLGILSRVDFLGSQGRDVVISEICKAAVLCLPSIELGSGVAEGLGQVLLEAGAVGRPVVASRSGGIPEVVRDGVNGLLVAPGDDAGLAAALVALLSDTSAAREMGRAGRTRVVRDFDLRSQAAKVAEIYRRVWSG